MEIVNVVVSHWDTILTSVLSLHGVASLIVATTSTPKDDTAVSKFYKAVELLALVTKKAKQK
jgi:hypothetical protein